jgi:hypothetical protein
MPTIAEAQIAEIAEWLALSSRDWKTPLGDTVKPGPYATVIPVGINATGHPDYAGIIAQGVLPLLTPQASPVAVDLTPPINQPAMIGRALHVLWKIEQLALPQAVVVGLSSASESIQAALHAAGLGGWDTTARGVLALPLYALSAFEVGRIGPKLPLL